MNDAKLPPYGDSYPGTSFKHAFLQFATTEVWDMKYPTTEADREAILTRLFKHFLNRDVVFED